MRHTRRHTPMAPMASMAPMAWPSSMACVLCMASLALPAAAQDLAPVPRLAEAADLDPDPALVQVALTAAETGDAVFPYSYAGGGVGPVIRVPAGATLAVDLDNTLPDPTTIHWHGVAVPESMDGTVWRFDPVGPGERFRYAFPVERPGTFWYHPHFDTARQVDGGLFGALLVDDPAAPAADDELVLIFDRAMEGHESPGGAAGHGALMAGWRINGAHAPLAYSARGGTAVRVRLINASSVGYLDLRWPGIRHIAGDQGFLPALQTPDRVVLGPGDRAEVEWLVGEQGFSVADHPFSLNGGSTWQSPAELLRVEVSDPAPAPAGLDWPFSGAEPSPDPPYSDIVYVFSGSDRTGEWFINGEQFPEITVERVSLGSRPIIEVRNHSPVNHPFHIHGNHFEVLSLDGVRPPYALYADTVDVPVHGRLRIRLEADNPGAWMTHCHILPHAEEGMMTVLEIGDPPGGPE